MENKIGYTKLQTGFYQVFLNGNKIGTVINLSYGWVGELVGYTKRFLGNTRKEAAALMVEGIEFIHTAEMENEALVEVEVEEVPEEEVEEEERRLTVMDYKQAEENGISYRLAYQRFYEYGWSKERTINEPKANRGLYKKWKPLIDLVKLKRHTFYTRVLSEGMTPFEACITPVDKAKGRPIGNGKLTEKHIAIAKERGISRGTVNQRVYSYRWSVERAITEPVHTQFRKKAQRA